MHYNIRKSYDAADCRDRKGEREETDEPKPTEILCGGGGEPELYQGSRPVFYLPDSGDAADTAAGGDAGCPLFDRSTRPVSLTPAGKAFLTEAKAILERMDQAIDRAHGASTGLSGSLRIGYLKGYEQSGFTDFLREFHQRHANLLITFYRCTTDQLAAGLLGNQFDLILTWDSTNLKQDERVDWLLAEEVGLVAALYAGHPLAQRVRLTRRELRGEPIIYMSPAETLDSYGDAFFMNLYKEAGYRPNILFCSSDSESILMMVAAEEGVSILPDYSARKNAPAENLVFIPLTGQGEQEEVIAAWRRDAQNPALAQFVAALRQAAPLWTVRGVSDGN